MCARDVPFYAQHWTDEQKTSRALGRFYRISHSWKKRPSGSIRSNFSVVSSARFRASNSSPAVQPARRLRPTLPSPKTANAWPCAKRAQRIGRAFLSLNRAPPSLDASFSPILRMRAASIDTTPLKNKSIFPPFTSSQKPQPAMWTRSGNTK